MAGPVAARAHVEVTVLVRPRTPLPTSGIVELGRQPLRQRRYLTRREYAALYGADPADFAAVAAFAHGHGLTIRQSSTARRSVVLAGRADRMCAAFGTSLLRYRSPKGSYRGRVGPVRVPRELEPVIQAVLGLDDRPQASTNIRVLSQEGLEAAKDRAYTPVRFADLYDFPRDCDGTGQRIAVIELGGGYRRAELHGYFRQLGVEMPRITAVPVDGARNNPGVDQIADSEVRLDLEVIGAVAPGAEQLVYFAPMTDRGFLDAITTAVFDPRSPSIVSISWGGPENSWTEQARIALDDAFHAAAALGITVCTASGDDGWTDILGSKTAHVDYPASSPYLLACGGTRLELRNGSVVEAVWNDHDGHATGGGVSELYDVPNWQQNANVPRSVNPGGRPGRGVPDVAGNADPGTGYLIGDGKSTRPQGGTSAVAPLWAGLVARLNQRLGGRSGFLNPLLYESVDRSVFNDVPTGTNGAYRARKNAWDACTGHGSPRGTALVEALAGPALPANP